MHYYNYLNVGSLCQNVPKCSFIYVIVLLMTLFVKTCLIILNGSVLASWLQVYNHGHGYND